MDQGCKAGRQKSPRSGNAQALPGSGSALTSRPCPRWMLVMELARCDYISRNENIIAVGNSGTGNRILASAWVGSLSEGPGCRLHQASAFHELLEARDEKRAASAEATEQIQPADHRPMSLDMCPCQQPALNCCLRSSHNATMDSDHHCHRASNLPFDEWTSTFGSERLTGALLDRLTHHVHILEMNGESYRLKHSRQSDKA